MTLPEELKNNMIKAYRAGGLSIEQQHYINQKLDVGEITQEELDGKKKTEEVTEEVSPSFIDRITTSIKEKSIPEFKQDVSAIKDLATSPKVMEGLFKLIATQESPEIAKQMAEKIVQDPSGIAKSVIKDLVDSAGGVVNPEDPYSWRRMY